jgi:G3E family GTPase
MGQKEYKREQGLTIEQINAVDVLVLGKTDQMYGQLFFAAF